MVKKYLYELKTIDLLNLFESPEVFFLIKKKIYEMQFINIELLRK